jgi:myo-inositol-1(or 4)-monophosphatase
VEDLDLAIEAARAGAGVVLGRFGSPGTADYKADDSPVTAVDRDAETAVLGVITRARPDDAILSEEGAGTAGAGVGRRWIVDPLDGTVNFMNGIPQVSVSVALYDGDEPLAGVVKDVVTGEEFRAVKGGGAMLNGSPMNVSTRSDLHTAVVATGFPYDHRARADELVTVAAAVLGRVQGIRRFGSAALDLAWTAAGRFDGYFELSVSPWDIAAGLLLVTEAGGLATNVDGFAAVPGTNEIVAAGPAIHDELRSIVAGASGRPG